MISDSIGQAFLKSTEGDRPRSSLGSPTKSEPPSSQILSLVEALTTARKEIDSQGDRVKQLETLLKRERKARESAEQRARRLLAGHALMDSEQESLGDDTSEPPPRTSDNDSSTILGDSDSRAVYASSVSTISLPSESARDLHQQTENIDASTTRLQERLDHMIREMDEMKVQLESYKRRAEGAEDEKRDLVKMVERIRAGNANTIQTSNGAIITPLKPSACEISSSLEGEIRQGSGLWNGTSSSPSTSTSRSSFQHRSEQPNGTLTSTDATGAKCTAGGQALEQSMAAALQQGSRSWGPAGGGRDLAVQSAPYVSMVGVVLIGVGIMTWLNGWQKVDR